MKILENYGKVVDGKFDFATNVVVYNSRTYVNPPENILFSAGYREVVSDKETRLGAEAYIDSFEVEEDVYEKQIDPETKEEIDVLVYRGKIKLHYEYRPLPEPMPVVNRYSVPDLFWFVKQHDAKHNLNNSAKIDEFLDSQGYYTVAVTTKEVSDDNELFGRVLNSLKVLCDYSDETVNEALEYAKI